MVDIYRDAKRRGIYPPLFTDTSDSFLGIALVNAEAPLNINNIQLSPEGEVNSGEYISTALQRP